MSDIKSLNELDGKYYYFVVKPIDGEPEQVFAIYSLSEENAIWWAKLISPEAVYRNSRPRSEVMLPNGVSSF